MAFSFHFDPAAKSVGPRRRIRRRRLNLVPQPQPPVPKTNAPPPERKSRLRTPPPKFLNSEKEILAAHQTCYRAFAIATMQRSDGSWTASIGRADGGPLIIDGKTQAVMMTGSYAAQSLALAETQIRIDMRR